MGLFRRSPARVLVRVSVLLVGGLIALHVVDAVRLDRAGFERAAGELLRKARLARGLAARDYQARFLAALPVNPLNGPSLRLDDRLADARALEDRGDSFQPPDAGRLFAFEFDDPSA